MAEDLPRHSLAEPMTSSKAHLYLEICSKPLARAYSRWVDGGGPSSGLVGGADEAPAEPWEGDEDQEWGEARPTLLFFFLLSARARVCVCVCVCVCVKSMCLVCFSNEARPRLTLEVRPLCLSRFLSLSPRATAC
jgi:hypothetical protein